MTKSRAIGPRRQRSRSAFTKKPPMTHLGHVELWANRRGGVVLVEADGASRQIKEASLVVSTPLLRTVRRCWLTPKPLYVYERDRVGILTLGRSRAYVLLPPGRGEFTLRHHNVDHEQRLPWYQLPGAYDVPSSCALTSRNLKPGHPAGNSRPPRL